MVWIDTGAGFFQLLRIVQLYFSDRVILAISGAKEIEAKRQAPELYRTVENLCLGSGLPLPKIYVLEDSAPNAFATGRDPAHAVICVTTGLLDKLDRAELEGVVAHELSHIKNFDIRLMSLVAVLVGSVALLADWGFRFSGWGGGRRRRGRGGILDIGFFRCVHGRRIRYRRGGRGLRAALATANADPDNNGQHAEAVCGSWKSGNHHGLSLDGMRVKRIGTAHCNPLRWFYSLPAGNNILAVPDNRQSSWDRHQTYRRIAT